jgi:hypothetical protein
MYANAVFAADIASNATTAQCVEPTLHRYEGTANLQAEWEANTVQLRWYNNYTMIKPTDEIDDCEYSGSLTRPTNPSRTGYTFTGWTVSPKVEFSTLSLGSAEAISYGKGENLSNHSDYCRYYDTEWRSVACSNPIFTELQQYEWKQNFANGTVYGMAHCTAKPGDHHSGNWPVANRSEYVATLDEMNAYDTAHSSEEKKYCWCQATGYKATNSSTIQRSLSSLAWVFRDGNGSASACANYCATNCAYGVRGASAFRAALFTPAD